MKKIYLVSILLGYISLSAFSQLLYFSDSYNGGYTGGGYAPQYASGGTGYFDIYIEPGATIRKALFISGTHGTPADLVVTLNGINYTLNSSNIASAIFDDPFYGGPSAIHAIDVTSDILPSVTAYTIIVPPQSGPANRYNGFYLVVEYEKTSLSLVNTAIVFNEQDVVDLVNWNTIMPFTMSSSADIGLALFTDYTCYTGDEENLKINTTSVGAYYGPEYNSGECGGPIGNFYYQNGVLMGMHDDNADFRVFGPDVVSNLDSLYTSPGSTLNFEFAGTPGGGQSNVAWAAFIVNGLGCPPVLFPADTFLCNSDTVLMHVSGANDSVYWQGAHITLLDDSDALVYPTASEFIYIFAKSDSECAFSDTVRIDIATRPQIFTSSDTSLCLGQFVNLSTNAMLSYSWQPAALFTDATLSAQLISPPSSSVITLNVVDADNCPWADTLSITMADTTPYSITGDTSVCKGDAVQLVVSGGNTFSWSPASGLSCSNCAAPVATPALSTLYTVIATDAHHCIHSLYNVQIDIRTDCDSWGIPNAFSPNGDGVNDVFNVMGSGVGSYTLKIYNRYGQHIFTTSDLSLGWDGTFHNKEQEVGTYVWYADIFLKNGEQVNTKGNLTLIR